MSNDRSHSAAGYRLMLSAALALGLAASAATAQAQSAADQALAEKAGPPTPPARAGAPTTPDPVAGVTVEGRARARDDASNIPADKRAQYDADVAKEAAFKDYRASRPPLTADSKDVGDPNDESRDFPGLGSYLPPK